MKEHTDILEANVPSQIAQATTNVYTAPAVGPTSQSLSYAYTVTTPTSQWLTPTFSTPTPIPECKDIRASICRDAEKGLCEDSNGITYGILCDTMLSGIVITNSGKFLREKRKRSYTGTFRNCLRFCDDYSELECAGVSYEDGYCQAYDSITGVFHNPAGGFAAMRQ